MRKIIEKKTDTHSKHTNTDTSLIKKYILSFSTISYRSSWIFFFSLFQSLSKKNSLGFLLFLGTKWKSKSCLVHVAFGFIHLYHHTQRQIYILLQSKNKQTKHRDIYTETHENMHIYKLVHECP